MPDIKHGHVEVLHPDLGAALGGERFLTEIRLTVSRGVDRHDAEPIASRRQRAVRAGDPDGDPTIAITPDGSLMIVEASVAGKDVMAHAATW